MDGGVGPGSGFCSWIAQDPEDALFLDALVIMQPLVLQFCDVILELVFLFLFAYLFQVDAELAAELAACSAFGVG